MNRDDPASCLPETTALSSWAPNRTEQKTPLRILALGKALFLVRLNAHSMPFVSSWTSLKQPTDGEPNPTPAPTEPIPDCLDPVEPYEQCAGGGYTGSDCCRDGYECTEMAPCYSQVPITGGARFECLVHVLSRSVSHTPPRAVLLPFNSTTHMNSSRNSWYVCMCLSALWLHHVILCTDRLGVEA